MSERDHAHELIDRLPETQLSAQPLVPIESRCPRDRLPERQVIRSRDDPPRRVRHRPRAPQLIFRLVHRPAHSVRSAIFGQQLSARSIYVERRCSRNGLRHAPSVAVISVCSYGSRGGLHARQPVLRIIRHLFGHHGKRRHVPASSYCTSFVCCAAVLFTTRFRAVSICTTDEGMKAGPCTFVRAGSSITFAPLVVGVGFAPGVRASGLRHTRQPV